MLCEMRATPHPVVDDRAPLRTQASYVVERNGQGPKAVA